MSRQIFKQNLAQSEKENKRVIIQQGRRIAGKVAVMRTWERLWRWDIDKDAASIDDRPLHRFFDEEIEEFQWLRRSPESGDDDRLMSHTGFRRGENIHPEGIPPDLERGERMAVIERRYRQKSHIKTLKGLWNISLDLGQGYLRYPLSGNINIVRFDGCTFPSDTEYITKHTLVTGAGKVSSFYINCFSMSLMTF